MVLIFLKYKLLYIYVYAYEYTPIYVYIYMLNFTPSSNLLAHRLDHTVGLIDGLLSIAHDAIVRVTLCTSNLLLWESPGTVCFESVTLLGDAR